MCVAIPMPDAGVVGPRDANIVFPDSNVANLDAGTTTTMDAGDTMPDAGHSPHRTTGACACTVSSQSGRADLAALGLLGLGLALVTRRRRRR
jgi:MYXO-CTERM domain-containing protein